MRCTDSDCAAPSSLRGEHQPANSIEEILVDELAQSFFAHARLPQTASSRLEPCTPERAIDNGTMTLIGRSIASAERSLHKTLTAFAKLQNARGFVPQKAVQERTTAKETGFVSPESPADAADQSTPAAVVPQRTAAELKASEYFGYFRADMKKYVESIVNSGHDLPENMKRPDDHAGGAGVFA